MKEASLKIYGLEEINNSKGYWASNVRYQMKQGISLEKKKNLEQKGKWPKTKKLQNMDMSEIPNRSDTRSCSNIKE